MKGCCVTETARASDQSGRIYLFYWYAGAWHPITDLPVSSNTKSSYDWTIPPMPLTPVTGSAVPTSHVSKTSIYIGNWVNGAWQCWGTTQGFKILDDGWVFTIAGGDKGGATLWFNTDESSFDGYGMSFKFGMFKIQGSYMVDAKGVINGSHRLFDFGDNPLPSGNGSLTGSVDTNATKVKLTWKDMSNPPVSVSSMSGVWLSELSMPEDWSVQISGSAKGTIDPSNPLKIVAYQDSKKEVYANVFDVLGSGKLSDGTSISIDGYLYFISAKMVYGMYQLTMMGANTEEGTFTGALNPSTGKFTFHLTSSNGHKYTFVGVEVATP